MAHETPDTNNETEAAADKQLLAPTLGRVVEQAARPVPAEVPNRSLRQRFASRLELAKAVKAEAPVVEIPLSAAKEPTETYIDLRREQVAEELHQAPAQSAAQAEAAADATLLGNTSQQLESQPADKPFTEVIQAAQTQTLEALQYPSESALAIEAQQPPVEYRPDQPMSSFVQSYLEKREQTVRAIAKEQFDKTSEPPEFSQAMQLADLLAYSERIFIDGTSLRSMYETKQITEAGLRRITAEYLRGGDVRKALGEEHMRSETKFERDPQMRNDLKASYDNVEAIHDETDHNKSNDNAAGLHTEPKSTGDTTPGKNHDTKAERKHAEHLFAGAWLILIAILLVIAGFLILR